MLFVTFLKVFIYLFLERGREGGEGQKHWRDTNINLLPLICALTGDQTRILGMCPDQGPNL